MTFVVTVPAQVVYGAAYHLPSAAARAAGVALSEIGSSKTLSHLVAGTFFAACGYKGVDKVYRAWRDCSFQFTQERRRWQGGQRSPVDRAVIQLQTGTGKASPLRQCVVGAGLLGIASLGLLGAVSYA